MRSPAQSTGNVAPSRLVAPRLALRRRRDDGRDPRSQSKAAPDRRGGGRLAAALEVAARVGPRGPSRSPAAGAAVRAVAGSLNGKPLEGFASPGSYFVLQRTWNDGDRVELNLPMSLH